MEKPNYFAIMPASVRYDKNLKPMEKIIYSEITALVNSKGYCYATNSYFANLYEVHKKTVAHWISNLTNLGYLKVEMILKKGGKEVEERRIYILERRDKVEGVDDKNIASVFEFIETLDFDYIMNSQNLWGAYDTVKRLKIVELIKNSENNMIITNNYIWDATKNKREFIL